MTSQIVVYDVYDKIFHCANKEGDAFNLEKAETFLLNMINDYCESFNNAWDECFFVGSGVLETKSELRKSTSGTFEAVITCNIISIPELYVVDSKDDHPCPYGNGCCDEGFYGFECPEPCKYSGDPWLSEYDKICDIRIKRVKDIEKTEDMEKFYEEEYS